VFLEVECGLPFYFKLKNIQKVMDYPPFEHVDWNYELPTSCQTFDLHISLAMSISREEILPSMEEILVAVKHVQ
jgi:hypothetical protein